MLSIQRPEGHLLILGDELLLNHRLPSCIDAPTVHPMACSDSLSLITVALANSADGFDGTPVRFKTSFTRSALFWKLCPSKPFIRATSSNKTPKVYRISAPICSSITPGEPFMFVSYYVSGYETLTPQRRKSHHRVLVFRGDLTTLCKERY